MCDKPVLCQYNFDNFNPEAVCLKCLTNLNEVTKLDREFDQYMDDDAYRDLADEAYADMMSEVLNV